MERRMLTREESGEYLGHTKWHIGELIRQGVLPVVRLPCSTNPKKPGRKNLIDVRDLDQLIEKSKERKERLG